MQRYSGYIYLYIYISYIQVNPVDGLQQHFITYIYRKEKLQKLWKKLEKSTKLQFTKVVEKRL